MKPSLKTFSAGGRFEVVPVLLIATLAFIAFYYNAYFSGGYRGMLGYETKDTLTQLMAFSNSIEHGSSLYWDPVYLQYTPRFPQAPIYSPVTLLFVGLFCAGLFQSVAALLPFYLIVLASLQILCVYTMYLFLKSLGLKFAPAVFGGLVYAYNHQTFVFGIRHGYERISAFLLAPLYLLTYFQALSAPSRSARRRFFTALSGLILGVAMIANGDIKPTAFFCLFIVVATLVWKPFSWRNLATLAMVFILAAGIFAIQGLPTVYSLSYQGRGEETLEEVIEYSLRPRDLILTHISTDFTPRPDYPWENTLEFSMSMMLLVFLGLFHFLRSRWRNIFLGGLILSFLWILGRHTPLGPIIGGFMQLVALRHPVRMASLLYFLYAFLAGWGVQSVFNGQASRVICVGLFIVPVTVGGIALFGDGQVPARFAVCALISWLVICGVVFHWLSSRGLWLVVILFILERNTFFSTLAESRVTDPTEYYSLEEIYRPHPRTEAILADPEHRRWRALFGAKEYPDLFSHNLYLNAFRDGIRPIFPYLYIKEEFLRVRQIQEVIYSDWSHPMWNLLNVKYFVDLEGYFDLWDEEDISRIGLDSLPRIDEYLRVNPRVEEELFVRYRREQIAGDELYLERLHAGGLDIEAVAYLDEIDPAIVFNGEEAGPPGGGNIEVVARKPDEITARVILPRPGVLVFSEFWFFPWQATVDGLPRPLRRAYHILQAVELEPGEHLVRFYFNSRHAAFLLPAIFSVTLILLTGVYCLFQWRLIRKSAR